jgi:squalene-hopene/tetraprenyl-beta-curcumene cyclase
MRGLTDCGFDRKSDKLIAARKWVDNKQLCVNYGDWKVYNPNGVSGGWSFEYENSWYPDVDDTAAVMLAFLKQDRAQATTNTMTRAAQWVVSMQNKDGGWGAFDKDNDKLFLNQIPFSDMDSLCDPRSPDVAGRVLEAFAVLDDDRYKYTVEKALDYLRKSQEPEGSWFGRWGVNYVYGTSNVLCGLTEARIPANDPMVKRALAWLKAKQNSDGGWGECLESYSDRSLMGVGTSTASQTAWGLMGLLAFLPASDPAVRRGVQWLINRQETQGDLAGAWQEQEFTGTGFPNHFYLRYHYYRHMFPMMALGRFIMKNTQ